MAAEKAAKPAAPNPAALIPALQNIMHLEIVILDFYNQGSKN